MDIYIYILMNFVIYHVHTHTRARWLLLIASVLSFIVLSFVLLSRDVFIAETTQ